MSVKSSESSMSIISLPDKNVHNYLSSVAAASVINASRFFLRREYFREMKKAIISYHHQSVAILPIQNVIN